MELCKYLAMALLCVLAVSQSTAVSLPSVSNSAKQDKLTEQLDDEGKYVLSWTIDEDKKEITFEVLAETTGYVGLGLSPNGEMTGADIFIAGVTNAGVEYSGDYHATRNGKPDLDDHSDWHLDTVSDNGTHTFVRVTRLLDTCDDQDYPITEANTARVIYAMGASDDIEYHVGNRGTKSINLIEVPEPAFDIEKVEKWNIIVNTSMPAADTTYWCTIHKGPPITKKHHVIGFDVVLDGQLARNHSHHFIVTQCHAPPGGNATELFEPLVGHPGQECYVNTIIPSNLCKKYLFVWAVGGKRTLFPENIGYAIGESEEDSYYMLEAHYDNPHELEGKQFRSGIEIYYTNELRSLEAQLLAIGHETVQTMIVPPNQTDFVFSGHCSPTCSGHLPESGLQVFNVLLHSHLSGRKLKLRQFRDGVELPWPAYDDTYDFDFQQNKPLRNEVTIMRGDHIIYECVYDSTWNEGQVVLGGLSSREEMCLAFLWVYSTSTELSFDLCGSLYTVDDIIPDYGITNFTAGPNDSFIITEPEQFRGIIWQDYLNKHFNWTNEFIQAQQQKRFGLQSSFCCARSGDCVDYADVKYPEDVADYQPEDMCESSSTEKPTTGNPDTSSAPELTSFKFAVAALVSAVILFD